MHTILISENPGNTYGGLNTLTKAELRYLRALCEQELRAQGPDTDRGQSAALVGGSLAHAILKTPEPIPLHVQLECTCGAIFARVPCASGDAAAGATQAKTLGWTLAQIHLQETREPACA